MIRRNLTWLSIAILLGLASLRCLSPLIAGAQEDTPEAFQSHPLVGAWIVQDVANPNEPPSITVFTSDGIVLDQSASGRDGAGSWRASGDRTGNATFVYVVEDIDGNYQGSVVIRAELTVDETGDTFDANFSYTSVGPLGEVVTVRDGNAHGIRVAIEPVDAGGAPLAGFPTMEPAASGTPEP